MDGKRPKQNPRKSLTFKDFVGGLERWRAEADETENYVYAIALQST